MKISAVFLLAALALQGCATVSSQPDATPAQRVYALEGDYAAALAVAVAYTQLPSCATGAKLCSAVVVKAKLQALDGAAWASLATAEDAVRKNVPADAYLLDAARAVTNLQTRASTLRTQ